MNRTDRTPVPRLIGVIHLPPLPGSPRWGGAMEPVVEAALSDARTLSDGGFDAILVENFGDAPFYGGPVPPETVAAMAVVTGSITAQCALPVGVNVLRNDARAALAICASTGARFVRVNVHTGVMFTDQGQLHGDAARTLRLRRELGLDVAILADVHVKHGTPPAGSSLAEAARDCHERGLADAVIVTGSGTGQGVSGDALAAVRDAVPTAPVLIGSGVAPGRAGMLAHVHGAIVGSAVKVDGRAGARVDAKRVLRLMEAIRTETAQS